MDKNAMLIIGGLVAIAVAYYLYTKNSEGFTMVKTDQMDANELMLFTYLILPQIQGIEPVTVQKAQEWVSGMITDDAKPGIFSINKKTEIQFKDYYGYITEKYVKSMIAGGLLRGMDEQNAMRVVNAVKLNINDRQATTVAQPIAQAPVQARVVEHRVRGRENETIIFKCPVRSGYIMYGDGRRGLRYNIPGGTTRITINNRTMGGDPAPGVAKMWDAVYVC